MLDAERQVAAHTLLDAAAEPTVTAVVHADFGSSHLLTQAGRLCGVIDFSDACLGDPALDLARGLHGPRRDSPRRWPRLTGRLRVCGGAPWSGADSASGSK